MVNWQLIYTRQAQKDVKKAVSTGLHIKIKTLLAIIEKNPFMNPPSYEKLSGDMEGAYSRRINIQHRLVYQVFEEEKIIKILRMWTHYE